MALKRRWRRLEDRCLAPLVRLEARAQAAVTGRPVPRGVRLEPTTALRWTFRLGLVFAVALGGAYALPKGPRRGVLLALYFVPVLAGLYALWRDATDGPPR